MTKDDLISRQAAIDAVHKDYDTILDFKSDGATVASSIEDILLELPSAEPERKKGKWKYETMRHIITGEMRTVRICSVCDGGWFRYDMSDGVEEAEPNFCPNCGADMRGEEK